MSRITACCQLCSQPFDGELSHPFICHQCRYKHWAFECAVAAFRSTGTVRECIHHFKYSGKAFLRHELAHWLALGFEDPRIAEFPADALIPVPLHHVRLREREFNQAVVLAKLLARETGLPVVSALKRTRYTSTQTKLDRKGRMENLRGAFQVRQNAQILNRRLILIDDVFTTGSTAEECSRVLRSAGAQAVRVLTVARG